VRRSDAPLGYAAPRRHSTGAHAMKYLRFCLLGVVLVMVLGTALVALFTEDTWRVERSIVTRAPPAAVAEFTRDLRRWPRFLPPDAGGVTVRYSYGETTEGPGARMTLELQGQRSELVLQGHDQARGLEFEVRQPGGFETIHGWITWQAEGPGTRVTLGESCAIGWNPIPRLLRGLVEEGYAQEFERSLARLAAAVDTPSPGG